MDIESGLFLFGLASRSHNPGRCGKFFPDKLPA